MIQVLLGSVAFALVLGPLFLLWSLPRERRGVDAIREGSVVTRTETTRAEERASGGTR